MKATICLLMLILCMYGIPKEEWAAMSDAQQSSVLDVLLEDGMTEMGCDEAEASIAVEGKWEIIYIECTEGQYLACSKKSDAQ